MGWAISKSLSTKTSCQATTTNLVASAGDFTRRVRSGERDVAQRVPERAPERRRTAEHNRRTQDDGRTAAPANRSSYCDCPESERTNCAPQTFTTVSHQSLNSAAPNCIKPDTHRCMNLTANPDTWPRRDDGGLRQHFRTHYARARAR